VLAHNGHITDGEVERLAATGTAVAALFTLGGAESVREVRVEGSIVYNA
jgi:hypothetical protein